MMRARAILYFALWFATFEAVAGSYRYGSLSWKHVEAERPNTVEFELVTAWTRSFKWVYVRQVNSAMRTLDSPPIVGDVLRVTGLTFADSTGLSSTEMGSSSIVVKTGDGAQYFVDVQVTAYSETEDWVMGNFTFRHSYASPYDANAPFTPVYPVGFAYDASTGAELAANQPFKHKAWVATFEGCCRAAPKNVNNGGKPYKVHTTLDLTDRNNAPAARTLPVVTVPVAASASPMDQPMFYVMAKDQYTLGRMDPKAMSAQTSNFAGDDDMNAPLKYKLATKDDLELDAYEQPSGVAVDMNSGMVTVTTSGLADGDYKQVAIVVDSGSARTVIDMMVRVIAASCQPMPVNTSGVAYTGEMKAREMKMGWVGYGLSVPIWVSSACTNPNLVLNYVFASLGVEASSADAQTGTTGGIVYNSEPGGLDSQGMPPGAMLGSMGMDAIVDVRLTLDNPFAAHRPGHDAAVNKGNRDYTNAPGAQELWDEGYRPVLMQGKTLADLDERALAATISMAAFNLNSGTGGAAVYMWVKKGSAEPAITEFAISTTDEEAAAAEHAGFMKLDTDVNEQSSSPDEVFVWYKKGSGAAITEVTLVDEALDGPFTGADFRPIAGYPNTERLTRNLNSGTETRKLFMYVKKVPQGMVQRVLHWVPQMAGHYILCYSGVDLARLSAAGAPDKASTQRCIDMDIRVDAVPAFVAVPELHTLMGKVLTFWVAFDDINHPDEELMIDMDPANPAGQALAGARFVGEPEQRMIDAATMRTRRMLEWFPDATYGGFDGHACFMAKDSAIATQNTATGCVHITVERCKWFVQTEDTLIQIAARFASNWLQIWHFNPEILHPDSALPPSNEIWVGHLYEIEPNDVLSVLAERFGTSIRHIEMNNWGLGEQLAVGSHICIIPNSCVTAEHVVRT